MKTETEIKKELKDWLFIPDEQTLASLARYAYNLQRHQQETINDLHQAANVIAAKYIAHPRVNTKVSLFADNEKPQYHTQAWDGSQHIMSELHQDPERVLQSFENVCKTRWGKQLYRGLLPSLLDKEKMDKVHDELIEFMNNMDRLRKPTATPETFPKISPSGGKSKGVKAALKALNEMANPNNGFRAGVEL